MNAKIDILKTLNISTENVKSFQNAFDENPNNKLLRNTVNNVGIAKAGLNSEVMNRTNHLYSNKVDDWNVMHQKQSGRCWIFAGMNLYKPGLCQKLNLKDVKLSANYVQFWDFLEKANFLLNKIQKTVNEPLSGRLVQDILTSSPEGGWWDMFISIVNKYGIVPEQVMPDTIDAASTPAMSRIFMSYLRGQAKELRGMILQGASNSEVETMKEDTLKSVYRFLVIHLGQPPETFDWVYENKDKEVKTLNSCTPLGFIADLDEQDCVTLINDPRPERPFMKHYTTDYIASVEGKYLDFLNVEIPTLKSLVKKMLDAGRVVWMSCDVGKKANHDKGVFDEEIHNYSELLGLPKPLTKADRLDYSDGGGTHAMLFTGYHEVDGDITKWRIENSWGDTKGEKGYYEMSDNWFDEHVYSSLISKEYLSKEQLAVFDEPIVKLLPWELPY